MTNLRQSLYAMLRLCASIALIALFAACVPTTPAPVGDATLLPRLLATVYISPTPEGGVPAVALQPTMTQPPTATPVTPTPYIGVFVGQAEFDDAAQPVLSNNPLTPQPTLGVVISRQCTIPADADFGEAWSRNTVVSATLGCPIQEMFGFNGSVQLFERGVMYRRSDNGEMWAISPGGLAAGDYWYVVTAPAIPESSVQAPEGMIVPENEFFSLWVGIFGIRDALGFASTQPQDLGVHIQRFDGGTLFKDMIAGQTFALFNNGEAYGPY